jgi:hypothetical protein
MLLSHALTAVQDGRVRLLNAIAAYAAGNNPPRLLTGRRLFRWA